MKSGIYKIKNIANGKEYIGSASYLIHRWKYNHLPQLRNNKHHSQKLQNGFNKYGEGSFKFEIIEECSVDSLQEREQYWIDKLKPWYNVRLKADTNRGLTRSEEVKEKIRQKLKGRKRKKSSIRLQKISLKKYKKTPEHLANIRKALKGKTPKGFKKDPITGRILKRHNNV